MIDLTEREKKLCLIKYIIHGASPFSEAPLELRVKMFKAACQILEWEYNEKDLLELGQAALNFQGYVNAHLTSFIEQNNSLLKMAHTSMDKGNESFKELLGADFVDKALDTLKKGKV